MEQRGRPGWAATAAQGREGHVPEEWGWQDGLLGKGGTA